MEILIDYLPFVIVGILASIALVMWACKVVRYVGLAYMLLGVAVLAVLHIYGLTFSNRLLLICLSFVILGFIIHVLTIKKQSKY